MKQRTAFLSSGLLAAALALGSVGPVVASNSNSGGSGGSGGSGSGDAQSQQSGQNVSDQKLQQFAAAYTDIRSVRAEYVPKLQQAQGQQEKEKLRKQGQQEMVEAIRSNGMKVSEYQRIGRALNNNQDLQQRLKQIMQEKMPDSSQGSSQ